MFVRLAFLWSKEEPQSAGKRSEGGERRAGRTATTPAIVTCWHWPLGTGAPLISYWMSVNTVFVSQCAVAAVCSHLLQVPVCTQSKSFGWRFWCSMSCNHAFLILHDLTKWRNLLTTKVKLCFRLVTLERETLPLNRKVSTGQVKVGNSLKWALMAHVGKRSTAHSNF